jgi:hypothetical protein
MPPRSRKPSDEPGAALPPEGPAATAPEASAGTAEPSADAPSAPSPAPDLEATRAAVAAADGMVRALLVEREGLVRARKTARTKQVDEQLRLRGYPVDPSEGTQ